MPESKIFSADSHVSEPGDLWLRRIDEQYRFRAPRLESRERNGRLEDFFCYEGFAPHPVSIGLGAAARGDAAAFRVAGKGYGDALPGGWDPVERLNDQDIDGVEGEVLYTTLGFRLFWLEDAGLQRACFRVYNDWLAEFCSHDPRRLVGLALISLYDIEAARVELRRASDQGHRGAMIWLSPPAGAPPYSSTAYDPFWAEAQDLGMPLVLHENTGGAESRLSPSSYWNEHLSLGTIVRPHEVQRTLGVIILSGVLERFPSLKIVSAENGTDWLPWFIGRVEMSAARAGSYATKLSLKPIDYLRRQVYFTYIDEPHAVADRGIIGVDRLMFSADYPHSASTWPRSQEIVERDMAGVPDDERRRIVHDNVLEAFSIPAAVTA
jgi:predicted TIM-barrel fold metal-dependent hydrolase